MFVRSLNTNKSLLLHFFSFAAFLLFITLFTNSAFAQTVQLVKRNASGFAIDGNNGSARAQNVYLWEENQNNVNQQWFEIDRGNGYFSYQKQNTSFCLDGNNGGSDGQSVYLWGCGANNQNQQWRKVDVGSGHYRLEKRNAPGFSLDGGRGGSNAQDLYLWNSDDANRNQHWLFNYINDTETLSTTNTDYDVSSLAELRTAIERSNQDISMRPGNYNLSDLDEDIKDLPFSGSNNTINLTGVYVEVPVGSTSAASYITMSGSNNTLQGGEFEDTYTNGATTITDFVAYNNDRDTLAYGLKGEPVFKISGDNNIIDGIKLTVRGSFPFGYGSNFGIGVGNTFGLSKRCGILVTGANDNTLQNVEVQQLAFCHGIYIQDGSDNTTIKNALVEGLVRPTNDMIEDGAGSLVEQANYLTVDGDPFPTNQVHSLAEDGIRAYNGIGSVIVEDSIVRRMRGGIRLYLAGSATVSNSHAFDCGDTNWNMPNGGTVTNSSGNFTYSPLSDFRLSRSNQTLDLTIIPSPNAVGPHNIADVLGNNHEIVFRRTDGPLDSDEDRVILVSGNNSTIRNETEYTIVLEAGTSGNTIISAGEVTDNGSNSVRSIELDL